jgi:hypothetical protein
MKKRYKRLRSVAALILEKVPEDIKSKSKEKELLPSIARRLTFGDRFELYYLAEKAGPYVPNEKRFLIGRFMRIVDKLAA